MKVVSNVTFMRAIVSLEDAMGTTSRMALFCKSPAWRDSPTAISTGRSTEGVRLQPSGGNGFIHTPHRCPPTEAAHLFGRATWQGKRPLPGLAALLAGWATMHSDSQSKTANIPSRICLLRIWGIEIETFVL